MSNGTRERAPGKPYAFAVTLDETGVLQLKWRCSNPAGAAGTIYQVYRRVGASGVFSYLGGTGSRQFTDGTVPAGTASVTYQIQAVRSTLAGPWAQFNVNFGVGSGGGGMSASVTESAPTPRAAA